jgi:cyanophycinase-like exopeptidase
LTAPEEEVRKASYSKDERKIGRLLVIGGAEDKNEESMVILPHFVEMCGGKDARILVCGTPSKDVEEKERTYRKLFEKIGVAEVMEPDVTRRHDGEDQELVDMVRRADVGLAPGLGYWRDTVVDTHFSQRGRVSRMLVIFAHNPQVLGVGLDEDTAIDVQPGESFKVLGSGAAFVFDGTVTYTNAPEASDEEVIAMMDSAMHVLPSGYGFDLRTKRPLLPSGEPIPPKKTS